MSSQNGRLGWTCDRTSQAGQNLELSQLSEIHRLQQYRGQTFRALFADSNLLVSLASLRLTFGRDRSRQLQYLLPHLYLIGLFFLDHRMDLVLPSADHTAFCLDR